MAAPNGVEVVCSNSNCGRRYQSGTIVFGRGDWEYCLDPDFMRTCLLRLGAVLTPRKTRLMICAAARTRFYFTDDAKLREAVALGEEWADTGIEPRSVVAVRASLLRRRSLRHWEMDWKSIASACLSAAPEALRVPPFPLDQLRAALYREQFGNPFVALAWNPEWVTATVRGLAARIYDAHEFSAMPILADALQDAGCDDEYVLHHCRANRPHARGCWVLDAILGKA
jgi:hypothetical protein